MNNFNKLRGTGTILNVLLISEVLRLGDSSPDFESPVEEVVEGNGLWNDWFAFKGRDFFFFERLREVSSGLARPQIQSIKIHQTKHTHFHV